MPDVAKTNKAATMGKPKDKAKPEKPKKVSVARGKNGGARPGAGRPKGSENETTRERRLIFAAYKKRVEDNAQRLLDAQLGLARGVQFLFKRETIGKGKNERIEITRVSDEIEIQSYLNGEYDGDDDVYYFITTEKPDNRAIDSMLDRTFGKAVGRTELSGPDGAPLLDPSKLTAEQLTQLLAIVEAAGLELDEAESG